jgi:hypothetical protein
MNKEKKISTTRLVRFVVGGTKRNPPFVTTFNRPEEKIFYSLSFQPAFSGSVNEFST